MQPIETYNPNQSTSIILQGPPGAGKTTLACQFPHPYVFDADLNLGGTLRWLREQKLNLPVGYDQGDVDENGKEVPPTNRWLRMNTCLKTVFADPTVETVILDSCTKISDYIIAEIKRQYGVQQITIQQWGIYLEMWKLLISQVRAQRKLSIFICHERPEKDDVDGIIKYFLALPGQIGNIFGGLVSDVWRCEVQESQGKHTWQVVTLPNIRVQLKNSLGLPAKFSADQKTLIEYLHKYNTNTAKP